MTKLDFQTIIETLRSFPFPEVDCIVGIASGGIVPAALIAFQLGKEATFISINYRNESNEPQHEQPELLQPFPLFGSPKRILLVDDVSVTGQTLRLAKNCIQRCDVRTFVLKGQGDYVLFPQIKDCVDWPWKQLRNQ